MNDQTIKVGQTLEELWRITYERQRFDSPIVARLVSWPHTTYYTGRGEGNTVEEARLALVTMLASAIHNDPDPFGNIGPAIHVAHVIEFLRKTMDEEDDYCLSLSDVELPEGWKQVVDQVITQFQGYMDYWPEEETVSSPDVEALTPPDMVGGPDDL
jgi:hypothetical protein